MDKLAFIDGTEDPWLGATVHSWLAKNRTDTVERPYELLQGTFQFFNPPLPEYLGGEGSKEV